MCEVLQDPEVVLTELKRQREAQAGPIDSEIERLQRCIKSCKNQELRLIKLYQFGEIDDEYIRQQTSIVKTMRQSYEQELESLLKQKEALQELEIIESQIINFCEKIRKSLEDFDFEEKRLALKALQVKAIVKKDEVIVKGIIV